MGWGDALGGVIGGAFGYAGTRETNASNERIAAQNLAYQREFAQQGIRWKVADAQAAGLHPLAALGAQTASFSPSTVGATDGSQHLAQMGQGIGRAIEAAMDDEDRAAKDAERARKLSLENQALNNDVLRSKLNADRVLSSRQGGQLGPPMPIPSSVMPSLLAHLDRSPRLRAMAGEVIKDEDLKQKSDDVAAVRTVRPFGYPLEVNPHFGDAQTTEDRYGDSEILSTLKAMINLGADHWWNYSRDTAPTSGAYRRQWLRSRRGW